MKNPQIYLDHILTAIKKTETYVLNLNYDQFVIDEKTQDAIIRQLEIIGEAAGQLDEEFKIKYPNLPWQLMQATRNKLIHEYFDVDLEVVWETLQTDLPELKNLILTEFKTQITNLTL